MLVERLAAMLAPPNIHAVRFHGTWCKSLGDIEDAVKRYLASQGMTSAQDTSPAMTATTQTATPCEAPREATMAPTSAASP